MHRHWEFKIFYRVLIKRLKQRPTLLLGPHEQYAKDNIPERWVGCDLSQLRGSTDCLPSLLFKGAEAGNVLPQTEKQTTQAAQSGVQAL